MGVPTRDKCYVLIVWKTNCTSPELHQPKRVGRGDHRKRGGEEKNRKVFGDIQINCGITAQFTRVFGIRKEMMRRRVARSANLLECC